MRAVITSAIVQMKQSIARPMFRFCVFLGPIFAGFLLGMIYKNKSISDFTLYAFLGSGMTTFWSSICFSSASDIDREKWVGTLPILFTAPIGFKTIVLGKILGNTFWGVVSFFISMFVVGVVFAYPIKFVNIPYLILIILLTILSMVALALILAGLFTISRKIRVLMNFIEYPMTILSGMVFPISILPQPLQWLSMILSPSWAMKGFELAINGGTSSEMIHIALGLSIITVIYFVLSYYIFERIDALCRINASLEVF